MNVGRGAMRIRSVEEETRASQRISAGFVCGIERVLEER
jgi:hypothetical protein